MLAEDSGHTRQLQVAAHPVMRICDGRRQAAVLQSQQADVPAGNGPTTL